MTGRLNKLWLQYQLLWAERYAVIEARAALQARANTIHYQMKANKLRRQIREPSKASLFDAIS